MMLNDMEAEEFIYKATDNGRQDTKIRVPKVISLKVGAPVMVTRNVSDKLLNGMTGRIQCLLSDGFLVVALDSGTVQVVRPVSWPSYDKHMTKVVGSRLQLPLQLAWAFTMHKIQGMAMRATEVHAKEVHAKEVFAKGQLYVGCSRPKTPSGLCVFGIKNAKISKTAKEVVQFYAKVQNDSGSASTEDCNFLNKALGENDIVDINGELYYELEFTE